MRRKMNHFIFGLLTFIIFNSANAANFSWEIVTNVNDAKDINISDNNLYAATGDSGVIYKIDQNGNEVNFI